MMMVVVATTIAAAAPRGFESQVFCELNSFRADPAGYSKQLDGYRARFRGRLLRGASPGEINIWTNEGVVAIDEAARALRDQSPLPTLMWSDTLSRAAADHVAVQSRSGAVGHYTGDNGPGERLTARGGGPFVNEVITYGHHSAPGVIHQLLIDDGVPDRGHRHSLLRPTHRYAGIACGSHRIHRTMCVTLMSTTRDGSQPSPHPSSRQQ